MTKLYFIVIVSSTAGGLLCRRQIGRIFGGYILNYCRQFIIRDPYPRYLLRGCPQLRLARYG